MNLLIIVKVALRSLRRTLLRSVLTMLGIIIGVAAVIAMVGIGNGAKARVKAALAGFDSNRILLIARMPSSDWRTGQYVPPSPGEVLTVDDYRAICSQVRGISAASPLVVEQGATVSANGRSANANLDGVDVGGFEIDSRKVVSGSIFGRADVDGAASVCLLSEGVAKQIFARSEVIGQRVRVRGVPFLVIGVLADNETARRFDPEGRDLSVYIPYTSLVRRIRRDARYSFAFKASDPAQLPRIQDEVRDVMEARRGNRRADFVANDLTESIKNYTQGVDTMTVLLASIAGISLVVGGIGIMNIMLVAVTERTREIGIRLALGTRGGDILRQFVTEAVILSVLGGLLGVALGVGAARVITAINGWPIAITPFAILGAFVTSAAIGIFFGWYPARKAAALDPIEALRFE